MRDVVLEASFVQGQQYPGNFVFLPALATPGDVMSALKKLGFSSFRAGQEEAVMRILCGKGPTVIVT